MNDGWITQDVFLAAVIHYLYGADALLGIDMIPSGHTTRPQFTFDIASCDGDIIAAEYKSSEGLAVADLNKYAKSYVQITGQLKRLHREGLTSYRSDQWVAGRGR
jgi:hypothetical protein